MRLAFNLCCPKPDCFSHLKFTGLLTTIIFCVMNIFPHFLYGPGEDALALTIEHGAKFDYNSSEKVIEAENKKTLCVEDRIFYFKLFLIKYL